MQVEITVVKYYLFPIHLMCGVLVLMIGRLFQQLVQQQGAQKGRFFSNKSNSSEKICNMKVLILIPSEHLKLSYVIKLPMFGFH